ncbi:MAG: transketolase, partial [Bacteroidetes bacterium]
MNTKIPSDQELRKISREVRAEIIRSLAEAGSGHTGGSLGLADIFTCLYFGVMKHHCQDPGRKERDRLILSIEHVSSVLYAAMALAGCFSQEELNTLQKLGMPGNKHFSGSAGQGLSLAVEMAITARKDKNDYHIYCILREGDLEESSIRKAAMEAVHHNLSKLTILVDRNGAAIDGKVEDLPKIELTTDKWKSFGWHVIHCDGHVHEDVFSAYEEAINIHSKPSVILADTIVGKGVSSIEGDN